PSHPGGVIQEPGSHQVQDRVDCGRNARKSHARVRPGQWPTHAHPFFGTRCRVKGKEMITENRTEDGAELSWEQRLLLNANRKSELKPEYQELKFTLHRKLLDRINLDAL